jgi:hypothetical protein
VGWLTWRFEDGASRPEERVEARGVVVAPPGASVAWGDADLGRRPDEVSWEALARVCVEIQGFAASDAELARLRGFSRLWSLQLRCGAVTDAGLAHLRGLSALNLLDLADAPVTDAGMEHVGALHGLVILELHGSRVTDAGLKHLDALRQLLCLSLGGSQVTKRGLEPLKARMLMVFG